MVTIAGIILVFVAFYFFLRGQFLSGLLCAWIMTFLDTVDGKLARTTLTSSKWGDVLDHGIDLIHPPFWYRGHWGSGYRLWVERIFFGM
jgi:phosphatidylglycerophosphate synthase